MFCISQGSGVARPTHFPSHLLPSTPQDSCCAYSQYCRPTQALLAALDGHGPQGHTVSGFLKDRLPQALAQALGEGAAAAGSGALAAAAAAAGRADPVNASFSSTARSSTGQQQQRASPSKAGGRTPCRSSSSSSGGSAEAPSVAAALASTFLRLDADVRRELGANANYSGSTAAVCMLQVWGWAPACTLWSAWHSMGACELIAAGNHPSLTPSSPGCTPPHPPQLLACRGGG